MKILTVDEFLSRKKHSRLAVMGCGYSINSITPSQWELICDEFDQIGMNWYCKARKDTTFYIVREQCVSPMRRFEGRMPLNLIELLNGIKTTLIVKIKNQGAHDDYSHIDHLDPFTNDGILLKEINNKANPKEFSRDIFKDGLFHGKTTMYDVLHFAVGMGYESIVFFGVDLYDVRYFWLPYESVLEEDAINGKAASDHHLQAGTTVNLVAATKDAWPDIKMEVYNPKSLLANVLPVWKG
jgi:hypothetical protein